MSGEMSSLLSGKDWPPGSPLSGTGIPEEVEKGGCWGESVF